MSDQTTDLDGADPLNAIFNEISALKNRAEEAAKAAEEANRKANSESGFAFNAKQNAEDHAREIAKVRGNVEADLNWLVSNKKNADEAVEAILKAKTTADTDSRAITEARGSSDTELAALRAIREKADTALSSVEQSKEGAAGHAKKTAEDAAAVTKGRANVEAAASAVQALQTQVSDAAIKVQTDAAAIAERSMQTQTLLTTMSDVTESAKNSQTRVAAYETELEKLHTEFSKLHEKIEALLPGATSAGLASAFRDQKARFTGPQKMWQWTFIIAIALLLGVGALDLPNLVKAPPTSWDVTLTHVLSRLPLAVPLIWLALYAGRQYMLAVRLQEDYAYKEAVSTSFEGFRREMAGMPFTGEQVSPLLSLCGSVLKTLGQRPGRLYDGKHDDVTPLTPLKGIMKELRPPKTDNADEGA
jgi:hypothetical protein